MIEAGAVVERTDGTYAWVRIEARSGGCGRCDEPGGCRSSGIAYAFSAPKTLFRLQNEIGAHVGDAVQLRMTEGAALRGALLSYGLGAALLILGAALGHGMALEAQADLGALAGGGAGLLVAIAVNRIFLRSARFRAGFSIRMAPATSCARHAPSVSP